MQKDEIKNELIKCEGNCYFKFCVYDTEGVLKVDRTKCIVGYACKPIIDWCRDGKRVFQYPFTRTTPQKILKLAQDYK